MIQITPSLTISDNEIKLDFVRAQGPGGQNVNKVSTAVQLRFNIFNSSLPPEVRERLMARAGKKVTEAGVLIIKAGQFRSQDQNRADAIRRLTDLIRSSLRPPKTRHKTKLSRGSKKRRLDSKRRRGDIKRFRRPVSSSED